MTAPVAGGGVLAVLRYLLNAEENRAGYAPHVNQDAREAIRTVEAMAVLPAKWRAEADSFKNPGNEDRGYSNAQYAMADELDAAYRGEAALGGAAPKDGAVPRPFCRDCADEGPICPHSGEPCGFDDEPATPAGGGDKWQSRFFIDHGVVHDRKTGQHVGAAFEDDSADRLLALLHSLENDRDAWRMTATALEATARLASTGSAQHPDDEAVDRFAAAMKAKLADARNKGRCGWNDKEDCPQEFLSDALRKHVEKGDPRDVANFCMFLHQRGEGILPAGSAPAPSAVPDGFVLVPKDPTAMMKTALMREFFGAERYARDYEYCDANFRSKFVAMYGAAIAAAPTQEPSR